MGIHQLFLCKINYWIHFLTPVYNSLCKKSKIKSVHQKFGGNQKLNIKKVHQLLTENAALVEITLGGGYNRYFGLFIIIEQYACIEATLFVKSTKPRRMETLPTWTPNGEGNLILL